MAEDPGVYLLFRKKQLVYVGRSKNPAKRVGAHRRNGRAFDYAIEISCPPVDTAWIERALIEALNPPQNRLGVVNPREERPDAPVTQIVYQTRPTPPPPDPHRVMSVSAARREAERAGFHAVFTAAMWSGDLRTYPRNPANDGPGKPRIVTRGDLDDWFDRKRVERAATGWRAA